jgi:hypothetical protein
VFAYDVADFRHSYIGKPGYNVTGPPAAWVGNNNTSDFKTTIGTTTVNIPAIGTREVSFVDIWNTGASNCCPSLFRYGTWGTSTGVAGSTLYTYSIIYKTKSGYTHPNFMYRYEYNGGSYITEVGVFDTAKRIDLGDGWYQAYNTFTTNASTNVLYLGMWYYQYNVYDTVYLYKASLTQGTHTFPPEQIIPPITTRSVTQGLLPLVGNSTIDLSNVSFDSNAQMTFDGTNDYIAAGNPTAYRMGTSNFTLECVMKQSKTSGHCLLESRGDSLAGYLWVHNYYSTGQGCLFLNYGGNQYLYFQDGGFVATTTTQYYHMAIAVNRASNIISFYVNGNKVGNDVSIHSNSISPTGGDRYWVGADLGGSPWQGEIPVFKHYNRALSAAEIRQNYLHYKTRFNLS